MDVAGPGPDRVAEDRVDQAHHRSIVDVGADRLAQTLELGLRGRRHQRGGVAGQTPRPAEALTELGGGGNPQDHIGGPGVQPDVVDGHDIGGVGRCHGRPVALEGQDQALVALGDRAGKQPDDGWVQRGPAEVGQLEVQGGGQRCRDLPLGGHAHPEDYGAEPLPVDPGLDLPLGPQRQRQLALGHDPLLDEDLTDSTADGRR